MREHGLHPPRWSYPTPHHARTWPWTVQPPATWRRNDLLLFLLLFKSSILLGQAKETNTRVASYLFKIYSLGNMCILVGHDAMWVCAGECKCPWRTEKALDSLKLELQSLMSHPPQVLGGEPESSASASNASNHWATSSQVLSFLFDFEFGNKSFLGLYSANICIRWLDMSISYQHFGKILI